MAHRFGGGWTEQKLEVVQRYFSAYAKALKNQRFEKLYLDAFAGTGERADSHSSEIEDDLFGTETDDISEAKAGSVRIALEIEPPFDRYLFVDLAEKHVSALEALKREYPSRTIEIRKGDANTVLKELARTIGWRRTRAAIFVDPYGMQVDWSTLVALAKTEAVDIALLFPTGSLNRMITRDGNVPEDWQQRIDRHLGDSDWRSASYDEYEERDLFSRISGRKKTINADGLRRYALERLRTIFPHVCETQLEMRNSTGAVLFHLFIICANPSQRAGELAMKIARSAMKIPKRR